MKIKVTPLEEPEPIKKGSKKGNVKKKFKTPPNPFADNNATNTIIFDKD